MTEDEEMAPSKARGSLEGRQLGSSSGRLLSKSSEDSVDSIFGAGRFGAKEIRDGGDDEKGNGSGNGGGRDGGDRSKGNNKSQDDGSNSNKNDKNNDGNNNNNDGNKNNSQIDSTTTSVVIATSTPELPPLAVPVAPPVTTSSSLTVSTTPAVSVVETTSVITSIQMATMTTIIPVMATIPPISISSQPRKGVDGPGPDFTPALPAFGTSSSIGTVAVTATDTTAATTATAIADSLSGDNNNKTNGNGNGNGGHGGKNDQNNKPPPGALDPAAEHALIAVGSIGAFVLICFVAWIIYRTVKKSRRGRDFNGGNSGFINKLPWRRNQNNASWDSRSMFMTNDMPPPLYEKGSHNSMEDGGYYGPEKGYQQQQPGRLTRSNTSSSQRSLMPRLAPGSVIVIPAEQYMAMSQTQSPIGGEQTNTMRSRMPDSFFNQSELARQPSDAYDPARRQVNRASELSSLSSGFGDGDIIIPEQYLNKPQPAATQLRQSNNFITRFSWMSRRDAGNRETVYTTTSEDRPAKYRSVGSWVNQQTGRLKRAEEKKQEVPPIPNIPPNVNGQGDFR
ncbi:hypothetical protein AB5N19_04792 [Seiridium cardinale]